MSESSEENISDSELLKKLLEDQTYPTEKNDNPWRGKPHWKDLYYEFTDENNPSANPFVRLDHFIGHYFSKEIGSVVIPTQRIGVGTYGVVLRGVCEGEAAAFKLPLPPAEWGVPGTSSSDPRPHLPSTYKSPDEYRIDKFICVMDEFSTLCILKHKNIVRCFGIGHPPDDTRFEVSIEGYGNCANLMLALEELKGGTIQALLEAGEVIPFNVVSNIVTQSA